MGEFKFVPLGIGDAFSAVHYTTSYALGVGGRWLLVDCAHPIRKMMREASMSSGEALDVDVFDAILLTHLHADHSSGLEGFAFYSVFNLGKKVELITHPEVSEHLWDGHLSGGMGQFLPRLDGPPAAKHLEDYFTLHHLGCEQTTTFGRFTISCRKTIHPVPTIAVKVTALGRTWGFSSDTTWDPDLVHWLSDADMIVHETNYGLHTPYEKLAALPEDLRSKMLLTHYPDDFDKAGSVIEPLEQGRLYLV